MGPRPLPAHLLVSKLLVGAVPPLHAPVHLAQPGAREGREGREGREAWEGAHCTSGSEGRLLPGRARTASPCAAP